MQYDVQSWYVMMKQLVFRSLFWKTGRVCRSCCVLGPVLRKMRARVARARVAGARRPVHASRAPHVIAGIFLETR